MDDPIAVVTQTETTIYNSFSAFTPTHAVTVAVSVLAMVWAVRIGRRWADTPREWRLRRAWCVFVLVWQVLATAWWCAPANYKPEVSLPLHLCDVAGFLVPFALWTQHRWLRALLYFWAIGLSTQAFVTPVVTQGLGHVEFWLFWVGHTQIVGSSVYDIAVLRFRPAWRDYISASVITVLYAAVVLPIDLLFGFNYGYIGRVLPDKRTILDSLPVWPWRLLVLWAIVQGDYLAIWLVWPAGRRIRRSLSRPKPTP
ncbi:MAG: TIGR02206 family membrane protein [Planctomycetes bacterium]|nr:TIGR02206 family membrane protein [Planctomycetota bacterium]